MSPQSTLLPRATNILLSRWMLAGVVLTLMTAVAWISASPETRTYRLAHRDAQSVLAHVQQRLDELPGGGHIALDATTNSLKVEARSESQQQIAEYIAQIDVVPETPAADAHDEPILRSYKTEVDPEILVEPLRAQYAQNEKVRIAAEPRTGQLLVMAPPAVQTQIARQIGAQQAEAAQAEHAADNSVKAEPGRTIRLQQLSWQQLATQLQNGLRRPLTPVPGSDAVRPRFSLQVQADRRVTLAVQPKRHEITIEGDAPSVAVVAEVITALDRREPGDDRATRLLSVGGQAKTQVRTSLAGLRTTEDQANRLPQQQVALLQDEQAAAQPQPPAPAGQPAAQPGAEPAGEPAADPQAAPQADDPQPGEPAIPNLAGDADGSLIGSVQIEFIEGLDVIVIRGNKKDVERVVAIIDEIERLSGATQPTIEILLLEHVQSEALATLIQQIYTQVLSARAGNVSITPLVKPNALLLIGRAESVETIVDLAKRLDQPVDASTQLRVFRLKHASSIDAKATIDEFFAERTGLGPRVRATADFRSNALVVQASGRDMAEVELLINRLDTPTSEAVNELRVFKLENSLAEDLAPILQEAIAVQAAGGAGQPQPGQAGQNQAGAQARSAMLRFLMIDAAGEQKLRSGILTDVRITADPRANALLVSAPPASMGLIAALVRQLDQMPAAEAQIKVFTIANGDATALVEMLETLFGEQAAQQGAAGPGGQNAVVRLRFSIDQRTNSIIASGTSSDLAVVEAILLRLDDSDVDQRQTSVYRLKNSPAVDVANAVNEFLRSERAVTETAPGVVTPFEQIEREVVVVPEPVSNSLIVSATPRYFKEIADLVKELDARPPMVMIQVLIAEVALNNTDEFGVELGLQDSLLFDRGLLGDLLTTTTTQQVTSPGGAVTSTTQDTIQAATYTPGFLFNNLPLGNSGSDQSLGTSSNVGSQGLSHFAVNRINSNLGFGGFVFSASSENISVLMRALQEDRRVDVLSRPQVMTLDNQPAFIQVGQRVPRITGTTINETGQVNSIQLENVGLILGVTPRISPDGLVVMEIDAEKSEVGPEAEGIPISISSTGDVIRSPRINTTTAQTTISALNGQTVVLGGLITKSTSETHRQVPFLGDLPLLGHLFRFDSEIGRRTELLIILTPRIVKSERDAELIKQVESSRMNWVLSDVVEMHGRAGLRSRCDEWGDDETTVIYPDLEGGQLPEEIMPGEIVLPPGATMEDIPRARVIEESIEPVSPDGNQSAPVQPEPSTTPAPPVAEPDPTAPQAQLQPVWSNPEEPLPMPRYEAQLQRVPARPSGGQRPGTQAYYEQPTDPAAMRRASYDRPVPLPPVR